MTINLPMLEATAAETITVTAESPLLSVSTSNLGGNVEPAAGAGAARRRAQLDGARAAGARKPHVLDQCDRAAAGPEQRRGSRISAEPRRPADFVRAGSRQSAPIQSGLDRRVPVHLEPVRRDAGPVDRRPGECDHEVRVATGCPASSGATSATDSFNAQDPTPQPRRADPEPAVQHHGGRSAHHRQAALLRRTSNTSASRRRASGTRRIPPSTSSSPGRATGRSAASGWTTSCRQRHGSWGRCRRLDAGSPSGPAPRPAIRRRPGTTRNGTRNTSGS